MKNVEQTQAALKVEHKNIKNRVSMPMAVALLTRRPAIVPAFAVLFPSPLFFLPIFSQRYHLLQSKSSVVDPTEYH